MRTTLTPYLLPLVALLTVAVADASAQATLRVLDEEGLPVVGATVEALVAETPATATPATATPAAETYAPRTDVEPSASALVTDADGLVTWPAAPPRRARIRYVGYAPTLVDVGGLAAGPDGTPTARIRPAQEVLAQAVVRAVRARPADPFAFENLGGDSLAAANPGQDIPFLLRRTPGAVYTSDAGTGIGYTGIRVRGADATRVNVTINGVPLNDSESHGVFWVNMPDFVSSTSSLQLQRGVGESTYGSGAFGANLNLVTNAPSPTPQLTAELGGGSFATARGMLRANTGDIGGFAAEGRLSYIRSDGFVDRASSRLGSAYLGTSWAISDERRLQLIGWTGGERTYQSWFGIPEAFAEDDALKTYNPAGDRGDGTFYDDQVDDYRQSHAQLLYTEALSDDWLLQLTGHYTHGRGFFELWNGSVPFGSFFPGRGPDTTTTDVVDRRWLDNDFFGAIATVSGRLSPKLTTTLSAGYSRYLGDHFGTVPYVADPELRPLATGDYYRNDASKDDLNGFAKANYRLTERGELYVDLQLRHVRYDAVFNPRNPEANQRAEGRNTFFNPKLGWTQALRRAGDAGALAPGSWYASAAVGQREPNRSDFENAPGGRPPRAEKLYNLELGLRSAPGQRLGYEAGAYYMHYDDQLALTGALNDVGEAIRVNIDDSYRLGLELSAGYRLSPGGARHTWRLDGNIALSRNRVSRYDETVFVYDDTFGLARTDVVPRANTPLAFSPGVVANLGLGYGHGVGRGGYVSAALWGSYVSRQYVDNSGSAVTELPGYGRADLELRYRPSAEARVLLTLQLQNLTGGHPLTNGYSYRYGTLGGFDPRPSDLYLQAEGDGRYVGKGVYPQAGLQAMAGVRLQLSPSRTR